MTKRFDSDFATEEQLKAFGRITVHLAQLESTLKWFLRNLINDEDEFPGMVITANISFRVICDSLAMLAERETRLYPNNDKLVQGYENLTAVLAKVSQIEAERNGIVHSEWTVSPTPPKLLRFKAGKDNRRRYKDVVAETDAGDLNAIAENMVATDHELANVFFEFMDEVRDERAKTQRDE